MYSFLVSNFIIIIISHCYRNFETTYIPRLLNGIVFVLCVMLSCHPYTYCKTLMAVIHSSLTMSGRKHVNGGVKNL